MEAIVAVGLQGGPEAALLINNTSRGFRTQFSSFPSLELLSGTKGSSLMQCYFTREKFKIGSRDCYSS